MNRTIDLRSDTVTLPTPEMRQAMANAQVGDDVYGEDPTVNQLEALSATMLGKDAGLFVPSGTMGNLAALLSHCGRGDEVILGDLSHTFLYEAGGISALGGIHPRTIPNEQDGTMALDRIESAIRPDNPHFPITRLICIENTHNRCGGEFLTIEYTERVAEIAHRNQLALHIDGARIFDAAVAQGVPVSDLVAAADSVTFCLSKSLCAPVGSVLCGSDAFIKRARRARKQLGGGMRQVGILAAAGIVALENMVDRLIEDHKQAKLLASGLREIPGFIVEKDPPPTNMVYLSLDQDLPFTSRSLADKLRANGILVGAVAEKRMRLVVHYWIEDRDIERTVEAFKKIQDNF